MTNATGTFTYSTIGYHEDGEHNKQASGTATTHLFLGSGCRHQWVWDHDTSDCMEAFRAQQKR